MKIVIELNHPKHYHQFKEVVRLLRNNGHTVHWVARDKDVVLSLLKENHENYQVFGVHKNNLLLKALVLFAIIKSYNQILKVISPDIIVSKASLYGVLLAKYRNCKSIIFPDSEVVTLTNKIVAPLADRIVTPQNFKLDFGKKHFRIAGFFENCYLHPDVIVDSSKTLNELNLRMPYAILRFIGWSANHDVGRFGFSNELKIKLVSYLLKKNINVYISSEIELSSELQEYKLSASASAIHAVLRNAILYIGDSQSMATEAALLGTPAIRSNSFVGHNDMSNFKVLEEKYQLLRNVSPTDNLFRVIDELTLPGQKEVWMKRKDIYFASVGDSNQQIVELIEGC